MTPTACIHLPRGASQNTDLLQNYGSAENIRHGFPTLTNKVQIPQPHAFINIQVYTIHAEDILLWRNWDLSIDILKI